MNALSDGGPSRQSILLGVASAAALASALWLAWPRRPKANHDALLRALQLLRVECAAVYAEVSAVVSRSGLPSRSTTSLASLAAVAASSNSDTNEDEGESKEEDGLQKLAQVLEQPLILQAALRQANDLAAAEMLPGGTAADLESTLQYFADDSDVKDSVDVIHEMHKACLLGERAASAEAKKSQEMWSKESTLEMLRALGQAKCAQLKVLRTSCSNLDELGPVVDLGTRIIDACAQAEDELWEHQFGDASKTRRCLFRLALESYSMEHSFSDRRVALESELEDAVAELSNDLIKLMS